MASAQQYIGVMEIRQKTLGEIARTSGALTSLTAVVGMDGFVDRISAAVDRRFGPSDNFEPIRTIAAFGERISAAAGKSANIELFLKTERTGGNGPIMTKGLLGIGLKTRYIGALGNPSIHPVLADLAKQTEAISLCEPGITDAVEFDDGKIMFNSMASFDQLTFDHLMASTGEGMITDILSRADLIAMVNWTMIPHMTGILSGLLERVFPNLGPRERRHFFFDLADPQKRSSADLQALLSLLSRYQAHGLVTLGMNLNEAQQVAAALGCSAPDKDHESIRRAAASIRRKLDIHAVVIHPTRGAACATRDSSHWVDGPYTEKPVTTTGAGDHFNAGFATAQLLGLEPEVCLKIAVTLAGLYVRTGRSPSLAEISHFIEINP